MRVLFWGGVTLLTAFPCHGSLPLPLWTSLGDTRRQAAQQLQQQGWLCPGGLRFRTV
ncbi:MAG TPA: hypothetical protein V6D29_23060 [Leptolyngbyaceae cyanobacterium]